MLMGVMVFLATIVFTFTGAVISESKSAWREFFGTTTTGYANVHVLKGMKADMTSPSTEFPSRYVDDKVIRFLDSEKMPYSERVRLGGIKYSFELQKFENGDNTCDIIATDLNAELKHLPNAVVRSGKCDESVKNGAVLWKQFADRYKLKIGDEVSFFINDSQNNMMPYTFVVTGLLENRTGNNMEVESDVSVSPVVFVNYQYMADLLGVDEGMCTEVAVWDRNPEKLSRLASLAAQCGLEFGYADELYGVVGGITRFIGFLGVIIGILIMVVFSVATFNINIMSFMERRKEIGTMVAIGADPGKVVRLFMLEMAGFGVISFGVSLMMYASLGWFMSSGVNFGELGLLFSDKPFMFSVPAQSVLITGAILAAALFISVLYPLYLVYRIDPVEVFREVSI